MRTNPCCCGEERAATLPRASNELELPQTHPPAPQHLALHGPAVKLPFPPQDISIYLPTTVHRKTRIHELGEPPMPRKKHGKEGQPQADAPRCVTSVRTTRPTKRWPKLEARPAPRDGDHHDQQQQGGGSHPDATLLSETSFEALVLYLLSNDTANSVPIYSRVRPTTPTTI